MTLLTSGKSQHFRMPSLVLCAWHLRNRICHWPASLHLALGWRIPEMGKRWEVLDKVFSLCAQNPRLMILCFPCQIFMFSTIQSFLHFWTPMKSITWMIKVDVPHCIFCVVAEVDQNPFGSPPRPKKRQMGESRRRSLNQRSVFKQQHQQLEKQHGKPWYFD